MPDSTPSIGRRRLLSSLGVLGAASAAAGAGTWALLSDTERTTGRVTAGTLDLRVGDGGTATLTIDDAEPGGSDAATIPVSNHGSVAGTLGLTVVDVRPTDSDDDTGADTTESDGPVVGVEFNGCGTVGIEFAADAKFPVTPRLYTRGDDGDTSDEERPIEKSDTKRQSGGRRRTTLNRIHGTPVAVSVDDRTWRNPSPCATDGGDAASVALAKALAVDVGYADDEAAAGGDPLVEADPVWDVSVPQTVSSDRTLAPEGDDEDAGSDAVLYVRWSVESDPDESVAGGSVEIELRPVIHS